MLDVPSTMEQFTINDRAIHDRAASLQPQRIAVVRSLLGLGDLLCAVPALRSLRTAFPAAQITLIGLPAAQSFVDRFAAYIDNWLEFPGFPGIPEVQIAPDRILSWLQQVQAIEFDLALQMHGSGLYINAFTQLLGAKVTAGFYPSSHACPNANYFFPYPEQEAEIWRNLRLLECLDIPLQGDRLEFPVQSADWAAWSAIAQIHPLQPQNFVCLHPGASTPERCWSIQHFAIVADWLAAQGWMVVLTGTAAERSRTQAVQYAMQFPAINLAGQTSLGAIAALLTQARLLICNDTGVSHLAAALQTESVVIFTTSDRHRWTPLNQQRHRAVGDKHNPPTMTAVLAEIQALLSREVAYAC
jgi:ADP-heptose:LPS heptosyltransferase